LASKILYKESVKKDLRGIEKKAARKILTKIETELAATPHEGKRLTGEFAGLYSLRVGDYRAIYTILGDGVLILRIGHRKEVYKKMD
jgi:mRNA interferase RelE/StbE